MVPEVQVQLPRGYYTFQVRHDRLERGTKIPRADAAAVDEAPPSSQFYGCFADLCDFDASSLGDKKSLQYFWFRLVFTTLTASMFRLVDSESELRVREGDRSRDLNTRQELVDAYLTLAFD
jgi:hypothetical protein